MVENISGENQETKIKFLSDVNKFLGEISRLEKDIPYQITVNDYETTAYDCGYQSSSTEQWVEKTCEREEIIGSHQETKYKDEWQKLEDFNNEAEFALPKDKIAYFKTYIEFPRNTKGEFFIEVIGDKQGWGTLDPWYDSNWLYKKKITIASSSVDGNLTDYPVYLDLSDFGADFHSNVKDDFFDIRITSSTEDGALYHELVTASTGFGIPNASSTVYNGTMQKTFFLASTITQITCSTNGADITIGSDERASSTPDTGGTDVFTGGSMVCDSDGNSTTTFANASIAAGTIHNVEIDTTANGTTTLRYAIKTTLDD